MQDQSNASLIDPVGECTSALLNLVITGKANPYLHNGIMITNVDDEFDVSHNSAITAAQINVKIKRPTYENNDLVAARNKWEVWPIQFQCLQT